MDGSGPNGSRADDPGTGPARLAIPAPPGRLQTGNNRRAGRRSGSMNLSSYVERSGTSGVLPGRKDFLTG